MSCVGIGKTTLANEICVKWARDGFLSEDFDLVLLIPLKSTQGKSVEKVIVEHIGGEEAYKQMKKSRGSRCLIILDGLDEIAPRYQTNDDFLVRVMGTDKLLEQATIVITSRPHVCENIKAGRKIEIVGLGQGAIKEFVDRSLPDDKAVEEFLLQANEYPHIRSLCYIPMNLLMIVDLFQVNKKRLPSTITEVYSLCMPMILRRQIKKTDEQKSLRSTALMPPANNEVLFAMLKDIPKEAVHVVFALGRLSYYGFFGWNCSKESFQQKEPKVIFTVEDLSHCGIEVSPYWDGYGLLKATPTHDVPVENITYNFVHLTIQEFLCAAYISTLSNQEQQRIMSEHFDDFPNVFVFLCGLTKLTSPGASQLVLEKLNSGINTDFLASKQKSQVVTALQCVYESGKTDPPQSATLFELNLSYADLKPYDCLCVGYFLSHFPVLKVDMLLCHIGDNGAEILGKSYSGHMLQELILHGNDLTVTGVRHVMKS